MNIQLRLSRAKPRGTMNYFMQNKPNLLNVQMNVNKVLTKDYENVRLHRRPENKPNQTQFFAVGGRTFVAESGC